MLRSIEGKALAGGGKNRMSGPFQEGRERGKKGGDLSSGKKSMSLSMETNRERGNEEHLDSVGGAWRGGER